MAKKKKPRKRKPEKPLLAVTGILHLQKSFVPPTQESGLLNTVGEEIEPNSLVLAPNYGYGISAAAVSELQSRAEQKPPSNIVHVNGVPMVTNDKNVIELNEDFPMEDKKSKDKPPDDLTIAELVRSIGGAKNRPFMRSDVVEDTPKNPEESRPSEETAEESHPEENDFYESLGMSRPAVAGKDKSDENIPNTEATSSQLHHQPNQTEQDVPTSVADYYKTYCKYYYSVAPDPYGDQPIEFSQPIAKDSSTEDKQEEQDKDVIQLARMAQQARRAMEAAKLAAQKVYGPFLPTEQEQSYDPLPMEVIPSETPVTVTKDTTMEQYWEYVKENPRDFNRWTYLVQHAENTKNIVECRKAYSAFLPLFPYCFGYWKRYCEIEKSHMYYQRSLSILLKALEFNPLCIDLWQTYLKLFREVYGHHENFPENMREQYEKALSSAGLEFRSDALWDEYIEWEINCQNLRKAFVIYRRSLSVPTRLYNRHWDNLKALVRDHHPRDFLKKPEYELLRKKGCKALGFRYKEEREVEPGEIIKPTKPEDKLMTYVKEKVLKKLEKAFKANEKETDKRWIFEDRIKRPYFHIKPLDKAQLRNWEDYLNFEIAEGNNDRIILLFERCLIACALYERFWCKYARYIEKYHRQDVNMDKDVSPHFQKSQISFDVASRKEIEEEETLIATVTDVLSHIVDRIVAQEEEEARAIGEVMDSILSEVCKDDRVVQIVKVLGSDLSISSGKTLETDAVSTGRSNGSVVLSGNSQQNELPPNSVEHNSNRNDVSSLTSQLSVPTFPPAKYFWHDIIRDVYKRACMVHCPRKPTIRLQWAAFEEEIGNVRGAKQLIQHVLEWHPDLLDAKCQMIELERRAGNQEEVSRLFEKYLKSASSPAEYSSISMKYARFLHKEQGKVDKALAVLRKAVKKDKGNHLLYAYVFEICHERFPSDRKGAAAALELAIQNKDLQTEHKACFMRKKVLFLQEHGELSKYRDALDQLYELENVLVKERAAEAAKLAASRPQVQNSLQYPSFPVPAWNPNPQDAVPINFEPVDGNGTPVPEPSSSSQPGYATIPPTSELLENFSNYGYMSKHPDMKLQETLSHKEYDKLVARGYPEQIHDKTNQPKKKNLKRKLDDIPMYIIPPQGPFLDQHLKRVRRQRIRNENPPS